MTLHRWLLATSMAMLAFSPRAEAQGSPDKATLTLIEVKTPDGKLLVDSPAKIRSRPEARILAELSCELKDNEGKARAGEDREFPIDSSVDENGRVVSRDNVKEFVGTELSVSRGSVKLDVSFRHDLKEPEILKHCYDLTAVGAARQERSVTAPRFERIRWEGAVPVSTDEQVIANFVPTSDRTKQIVALFRCQGKTDEPRVRIEQTIYRVPELPMIERMVNGDVDDALLLDGLDAQVISTISTVSTLYGSGAPQSARETWIPVEIDPDYDRLWQIPCAFKPALTGTRLEFSTDVEVRTVVQWKSIFAPRDPVLVQWPGSWLHVYDPKTQKPTGKAVTGWMDWYDRFEERVTSPIVFTDDSPHLVSVMPPPDQLWGTDRKGRWLDVTMARRVKAGGDASKSPAAKKTLSPRLLLGISIPSQEAVALLEKRSGKDDATLLRDLLTRVKSGSAAVQAFAVVGHSDRQSLVSARMHSYPTEMPSIPSAWDDMPIGTSVEIDDGAFQLYQDLAPPSRMEWKLARDVPEAIMWEPSRRVVQVRTDPADGGGTHLCAVTQVPSVMTAADVPAGHSILFFTHQSRVVAKVDGDESSKTPPDPPLPVAEVETTIFKIPAKDAASWQQVKQVEWSAFMAKRLKNGEALLEGHALLRLVEGREENTEIVEEQMTAVEFDPPEPEAPGRMRPTALETLHCGTTFKASLADGFGDKLRVVFDLRHTMKKPIEPGLEETLKIAATGKEDYPGAKHFFGEWQNESLLVAPGAVHCLGVCELPDTKDAVLIAFIRVRPVK